jgi:hypothetical protein
MSPQKEEHDDEEKDRKNPSSGDPLAAGRAGSGAPPIAAIRESTPASTAPSRSPARIRGTMSFWMMRPARASGTSPSSP